MEQAQKTTFDRSAYNTYLFVTYKTVKKIIKYSFYFAILYFVYEGFMAWD